MFVIKNRDINVLSRPSIDESRILDIYKNEDGETCFLYEFYFNADMRVAINTKNFKVRLSARKNIKKKSVNFISDLQDSSRETITESLYTKDKSNRQALISNDRHGLIKRKTIDLTKKLSNLKLKNAKRLDDRALFGIIKKTEIISISNLKKRNIEVNLPQRDIFVKKDVANRQFSRNYSIAIKNGIDPSVITRPRLTHMKADPRKVGSILKKQKDVNLIVLRGARNTALDTIEKLQDSNITNTSQMSDSAVVGINVSKIDRVKIIPARMILKRSSILGRKFFYIKLDLLSTTGIIVETLEVRINHRQNVEDYYVPKRIVKTKTSSSFKSPRKRVMLTVIRNDKHARGYKSFVRTIYASKNYEDSPFVSAQAGNFNRYDNRKSRGENLTRFRKSNIIRRPLKKMLNMSSTDSLSLIRTITIGKLGTHYGNFSSAAITSGNFLTSHFKLYTKIVENGIKVSVRGKINDEVAGICFLRREKRNGVRTKWEKVLPGKNNAGLPSDLNSPVINESITEPPFISIAQNNKRQKLIVTDRNVKQGRMYEYKIKAYMRNGVFRTSVNSRFEKFAKPSNAIKPRISKIKSNISTDSNALGIPVSFNISYSIPGNDSDVLLKLLSVAGLEEIYSEEISEIKESLSDLICFKVDRFDMLTGVTEFLGYTGTGEFKDDGSDKVSAPSASRTYIYRISSFLVSPDEAVQELIKRNSSTPTKTLSTSAALRQPATYSSIRRVNISAETSQSDPATLDLAKITSTSFKNISTSGLIRGSLPTAMPRTGQPPNILGRFPTGDSVDKTFTTGTPAVAIVPGEITFGGHGGTVVRWSVSSSTGSKYLDYFVVIAKKQGKNHIVGNCHAFRGNNFTFIDYPSAGYVGFVEYFVMPVFLDGTNGSTFSIGSTILQDRNIKFRRSN